MFFLKELPSEAIMRRYAARFPEMDLEKTRVALHMMRSASLLIRDLESYFREFDLSMARFLILIVLDREPDAEPFTISDLVSRLDISKPVITNTVKRLSEDDLVGLRGSNEDGRAKLIRITDSGKALIDEIMPGYYRLINEHIEN